jgi:hypothetical protein
MHRLRLCRLDPSHCDSEISLLRREVYTALDPLFEVAARQNAIVLLGVVEEVGVEYPEVVGRTVAAFTSVFEGATGQQQVARLLSQWRGDFGRGATAPELLSNIAKLLESDQRDKAMQAAGLTSAGDWPGFFQQLLGMFAPTQAFVSGLVALIRATLANSQPQATVTTALLDQTARALYSEFETRDEMVAFLTEEFPGEVDRLPNRASTYNEMLYEVVRLFEREGKTEELVARALAREPENTLLESLHQQLKLAVGGGSNVAQALSVGGQKSVAIGGNIVGGTIYTGDSTVVNVQGNIVGTTVYTVSRYLPREELDRLPKMIPFSEGPDVMTPPEFVFNWALGMRQAMQAVCLAEAHNSMGTAFLVAPDLLLFGWSGGKMMSGLRFRFDYSHTPDGSPRHPTIYVPARDWEVAQVTIMLGPEELHFGLVRLEGAPGSDLVPGENVPRGWLSLTTRPVVPGQGLCMLHHALGGPQMLEYASAQQTSNGEIELSTPSRKIRGGAGGAPCCNEEWQVVAIRMGMGPKPGRSKQNGGGPLLAVWVRDLLANAEFAEALQQHLPKDQQEPSDTLSHLQRLRETLSQSFNYEELQSFAGDLGVDWNLLAGETRSAKAASLLDYVTTKGTLENLVQHGLKMRPQAKWE